jgi:signal transduction histidine kinase
MAVTWMAALLAYVGVAWAEGRDDARSHPRDDRAAEARADLLASHVTAAVGRARDAERARLAALCEVIGRGESPDLGRMVEERLAGSPLRDVRVLRPDPSGEASLEHEHFGGEGRPPRLRWGELERTAPILTGSARLRGVDHGLASTFPSPEGLGVARIGCAASTPAGVDHVVVGHLDVVALASEALPETIGSVALESEEDRAPGLRRWLGPAGDGPRPALRVRLEAAPVARAYPIAPALAALLVALAVFYALRPRPARVLSAIEEAARRVGEGDLDVTLDAVGGAADGTFTAFNRMTKELKDARAKLVRAERVAAWRDVARRIAHEIKNPLTPIRMAIETLRKAKQRNHPELDDIFEESTTAVLEEVQRMERIVSEFSRFARMPRPKAESLDVTEVAEHVVQVHALPAEVTQPEGKAAAQVKLEAEQGLMAVRADRGQLTQVLTNLVQNAVDAAKEKSPERPRVLVRLAGEEDGVRIEVHDNGPGIPEDGRAQVLEPYYTTKAHGTGLGLAIVDRIVADHGGSLAIEMSSELGGALVVVRLRREGPAEEAAASRPSQP